MFELVGEASHDYFCSPFGPLGLALIKMCNQKKMHVSCSVTCRRRRHLIESGIKA